MGIMGFLYSFSEVLEFLFADGVSKYTLATIKLG